MDFVIAGFALGAVFALAGFALWEFYGNEERPDGNWRKQAAIGFMLCALVVWAVTVVALLAGTADPLGWQLVVGTTLLGITATAGGAFWYWRLEQHQYGTASQVAQNSLVEPENADPASEVNEWDSWPERDSAAVAVADVSVANDLIVDTSVPDSSDLDRADSVQEIVSEDPVRLTFGDESEIAARTVELDDEDDAEQLPVPSEGGDLALVPDEPDPPVVEVVEVDQPLGVEEAESEKVGQFDSPLLADIDAQAVNEQPVVFRSPLLADLEPGSELLETVGLAKWPKVTNGTADADEETPPPHPTDRASRQ